MIIHINASKEYDIYFERGLTDHLKDYINDDHMTMIISDSGVPSSLQQKVFNQFKNAYLMVVEMGEQSKGFETFEMILKDMLKKGFSRKDRVIALGGGVVGDLSGFVAASYMRGIEFINIPTTTLSQIDSSIGGKVAINVEGYKNSVGAFYQPSLVIIDPNVLDTLTKRHFNNGLVEAVKAGLIYDKSLFEDFEQETLDVDKIIYKSLLVKKYVVEQDETEQGLRKILNFGHTIGHAYETYYHLKDYYHGECVALGIMSILEDEDIKNRTKKIFERLNVPTSCDADMTEVFNHLKKDKKADHTTVDLVKVYEIGKSVVEKETLEEVRKKLVK